MTIVEARDMAAAILEVERERDEDLEHGRTVHAREVDCVIADLVRYLREAGYDRHGEPLPPPGTLSALNPNIVEQPRKIEPL